MNKKSAKSPARKITKVEHVDEVQLIDDIINSATPQASFKILEYFRQKNIPLRDKIKEELGKSFSKWNWDQVRPLFSLQKELPRFEVGSCLVPQEIHNVLLRVFRATGKANKGPTTGKEVSRLYYIKTIFIMLLEVFEGNVELVDEGALNSDISQGNVEIVIRAFNEVIMNLLEAKRDDMEKGKAQLLLELHAADSMNSITGIPIRPLHGVVSTGVGWVFYEYKPQEKCCLKESDVFSLQKNSLSAVLPVVYWMILESWKNTQEAYVASYERVINELTKKNESEVDSMEKESLQIEIDEYMVSKKYAEHRLDNSVAVLKAALDAKTDQESTEAYKLLQNAQFDSSCYPL